MAHYSGEGGIQISRARLWEFLELHADPAVIGQIHPDVLHQSVVRSSPKESVLERTLRVPRNQTLNSTWKVTSDPPETFRWEIIGGDGPMETGSWVENHYVDAPEGSTWVRTEAEISIRKVPRFLQKTAVRRVLNSIDTQDLAYLQAHP
ncbi:MAG TPA: hypothetical protein VMV28_08230 [Thermoplasmata archaeon]|nr:hypothetical protein [Thermoplasmata archaeon]